jgi:hypothetical protein
MAFDATKPAGTSLISDLDTLLQANFAVLKYRPLFWYVGYPQASTTVPVGISYTMPFPATVTKCWLTVTTAPTGADLTVDIHKNGTTIWTTQANRVKITAGATTGNTTTFDITSIAANDVITAYVDVVGSSVAGVGLTIQLDTEHA